jgi:uncharacterized protein (TIGR03089 family)
VGPVSDLIPSRLRRRARTAGAEPLLTYYEPATGARTELSAVTLLNWVDKTSHLLDALGLAPGDAVHLPLAGTAPGHWVTAVWELACWQVGVAVRPDAPAGVDLVVTGPDWSAFARSRVDVVACSLHPLGLPLGAELPAPVLDYALEVRGQPDVYPAAPAPPMAVAWADAERRLSQADLVAGPAAHPARRLVRPTAPWATAQAALVVPLLGGGSTVVVAGEVDDAQLARIRSDERAED